jgi:hypothetical protein
MTFANIFEASLGRIGFVSPNARWAPGQARGDREGLDRAVPPVVIPALRRDPLCGEYLPSKLASFRQTCAPGRPGLRPGGDGWCWRGGSLPIVTPGPDPGASCGRRRIGFVSPERAMGPGSAAGATGRGLDRAVPSVVIPALRRDPLYGEYLPSKLASFRRNRAGPRVCARG